MDQAWRRAFSFFFLIAVINGCSDDPEIKDAITEDSGIDSGRDEPDDNNPPDKRDAATSGNPMTGTSKSCDELDCKSPATCKESGGKASCACPDGYDDTKGDGSECKDKDECAKDADNDCDKNASCENKPGGYECKCKGPSYSGDGKSCKCADGFSEKDGACLAPDGNKCEDDLDCENGNCEGGTCCAQACSDPEKVCTTTKGATCEDGKTCKYPVSPDGEACDDTNACLNGSTCKDGSCQTGTEPVNCDDGNSCTDDSCDTTLGCRNQNNTNTCDDNNACTSNDRCASGLCAGMSTVDCSAQNDDCNTGTCNPANGTCGKKPKADGGMCDDDDTCTLTDQCNGGTCTGQGNACGPNANSCTQGTPNDCECKTDYLEAAGLCVPMNNECDSNPCATNATCFDPSNGANDVTCKCNAGYEGDGRTCIATMPCMNNPCGEGRGTCTEGAAGTYTCDCDAGYKEVAGACVCDLTGTFAGRKASTLTWTGMDSIENGSSDSYEWYIQRHNYDDDGNLTIETIQCGESAVDLCGTGNALLSPEAYTQYVPAQSYEQPSWPTFTDTIVLKKALPNELFETQLKARLVGISLTDPTGAWPSDRAEVAGGPGSSGTPTNGARWVDVDNDSSVGITNYEVGPGGISAEGTGPRPITSYGATSQACPRSNPNAARLSYNWAPALEGALTVRRIKRIYSAYRTINALRGKIDSCDTISGRAIGPNPNDHQRIDGIVGGCVRVEGSGEADCSTSLVNFFQDGNQNSQDLEPADFVAKRAADNVTCAQVRAMSF
jgi:hypothetical protein